MGELAESLRRICRDPWPWTRDAIAMGCWGGSTLRMFKGGFGPLLQREFVPRIELGDPVRIRSQPEFDAHWRVEYRRIRALHPRRSRGQPEPSFGQLAKVLDSFFIEVPYALYLHPDLFEAAERLSWLVHPVLDNVVLAALRRRGLTVRGVQIPWTISELNRTLYWGIQEVVRIEARQAGARPMICDYLWADFESRRDAGY